MEISTAASIIYYKITFSEYGLTLNNWKNCLVTVKIAQLNKNGKVAVLTYNLVCPI